MATVGFTVDFWAWNLIGPLGPTFGKDLHLSSAAQPLLVAVPVLVGAAGRVPVGALTDKLGARVMFPLVSFLTIIPVLLLIPAKDSLPALLAVGFLLGLGGTTFAIGVPLVNSWFPPARRGAAIGVFGMGMGGTARAESMVLQRTDDVLEAGVSLHRDHLLSRCHQACDLPVVHQRYRLSWNPVAAVVV